MEQKFNQLLVKLSKHSLNSYPAEACGIVTKDMDYIECKNISPQPKISFILDPVAIYKYEDSIWGFYHSHPGDENPLPSEKDVASTIFKDYKFLVGFKDKFFIYWFDKILRYEPFTIKHFYGSNTN